MLRDEAYLLDMLIAARKAGQFAAGKTWEDFVGDEMLQIALIHMMIQIVGEAAANVSAATRARYPEIPWGAMVGMRNLLVHRYWDTDRLRVWHVVQNHLPALITVLEPLVPPEEP